MAKTKKKGVTGNIVAQNRKARHDYFVEETLEAGIVLKGTEVKSLRDGRGNISDAYAVEKDGELILYGAHISEYKAGGKVFNHEPLRPRKLLLHKRELAKLFIASQRQGMTVVPLDIHFSERGIAKVTLAIARGKHHVDKRQTSKDRDWKRDKARLMRARG